MPKIYIYCDSFDKLEAVPGFIIKQWPASIQMQSKYNISIKGFWQWKCQDENYSIYEFIHIGKQRAFLTPTISFIYYIYISIF